MRSDMDLSMPLRYTLRGPGVDMPPVGNFMVDEYKGFVRIIRPLDREERENYTVRIMNTQYLRYKAYSTQSCVML